MAEARRTLSFFDDLIASIAKMIFASVFSTGMMNCEK